jgi:hypothetical protein
MISGSVEIISAHRSAKRAMNSLDGFILSLTKEELDGALVLPAMMEIGNIIILHSCTLNAPHRC